MKFGSSSCRVTGVSSLNLARRPLGLAGFFLSGYETNRDATLHAKSPISRSAARSSPPGCSPIMSIFILACRTWLGPFAGWLGRGYLGVDGFFLLSGLILARTHPEFAPRAPGRFAPKSWRFLTQRLARIYPVHVAILCLLAVFLLLAQAQGFSPRIASRFGLVPLVQNLLLIQGWGFADAGTWNYPSWSISTEWAGYLAFPVLWRALCWCEALVAGPLVLVGFLLLGLLVSWHHQIRQSRLLPGVAALLPRVPDRHGHRAAAAAYGRQRAGAGAGAGRAGAGRRRSRRPAGFFRGAGAVAAAHRLRGAARSRMGAAARPPGRAAGVRAALLRVLYELRRGGAAGGERVPAARLGAGGAPGFFRGRHARGDVGAGCGAA